MNATHNPLSLATIPRSISANYGRCVNALAFSSSGIFCPECYDMDFVPVCKCVPSSEWNATEAHICDKLNKRNRTRVQAQRRVPKSLSPADRKNIWNGRVENCAICSSARTSASTAHSFARALIRSFQSSWERDFCSVDFHSNELQGTVKFFL